MKELNFSLLYPPPPTAPSWWAAPVGRWPSLTCAKVSFGHLFFFLGGGGDKTKRMKKEKKEKQKKKKKKRKEIRKKRKQREKEKRKKMKKEKKEKRKKKRSGDFAGKCGFAAEYFTRLMSLKAIVPAEQRGGG